ncbi:MAG: hypothetical protein MRQ09_04795 [Candidatus Midichloria sp.]|nr:hypothetical protein [Candidatus Midichloria sp.]
MIENTQEKTPSAPAIVWAVLQNKMNRKRSLGTLHLKLVVGYDAKRKQKQDEGNNNKKRAPLT